MVLLIGALAAVIVAVALFASGRGSRPTHLLALDRDTGHQIWDVRLGALGVNGVTSHGKTLDVAGWAEFSHCDFGDRGFTIDSASGQVLDTRKPKDAQPQGPQVDDGEMRYRAVFSKAEIGRVEVSASDLATRTARWQRTFAMTELPEMTADDGVVILTSLIGGAPIVLDGTSGRTLWQAPAGPSLAVPGGGDGRVYVSTPGRVEARDSHTGAVQWRVAVSGKDPRGAIAQVASDKDLVVVGTLTRLRVYDHAGHPYYTVRLKSSPNAVFVGPRRIYVNYGGRASSGGCD